MSAVYFMGCKKVESKKSGKVFFPANFLTKNSFGDWSIITKFCASADVAAECMDILPGSPCVCTLGMNGELLKCIEHSSCPALELDDADF